MKFIAQIVSTLVVCLVLQYFLPWWTLVLGAAAAGYYFGNKGYLSFLAGFLGAGLLWFAAALSKDLASHSLLTQKVNQLLPVNAFILTVLVGGLVGGFAALTGSSLKTRK